MATTTEKKVIIIDVQGSTKAIKDIKALQKHAASADRNIGRMGKTLGQLGFTVKAFIAYRLTSYIARIGPAFLDASDAMTLMKARLDLVNEGTLGTVELMSELFDVAERSRGTIDAVSTLYTRLTASTKELNVSQKDLLNFTELVSDTFILSGASAGEAASGVTQLSQAFSKGKLDGDEFKSIMENNVYFGTLLAKTLGKTRGELLNMSKAGEITSEVMLGMTDNIEDVRKKMEDMPLTVAQSVTSMENSFKRLVGSDNEFSRFIAEAFEYTAKQINAFAKSMEQAAIEADKLDSQSTVNQLRDLNKEYADVSWQVLQFVKVIELAEQAGASDDWIEAKSESFKVYSDRLAEIVQLQNKLREELSKPVRGDTPDAPEEAKATPFSKWVEGIKKAESELKLFYPKLEKLDQLFFNESISESVYNKELEKLTGNLSVATGDTDDFIAAQEKLNNIIDSGRTDREVLNDQIAEINAMIAEMSQLAPEGAKAIAVLTDQFDAAQMDKLKDQWIDWEKVATTAVGGVTGAFIDMAVSGENSFEDFAQSFLLNIAKMVAQAAVLQAISSPTGGLFGLFPSAEGNAFQGGNVVPFASGGVVTSPTLFPMANGTGLMGEAGPEAVMPLDRGSDGKLGVKASGLGGGVVVNINDYSSNDVSVQQSTDSQGVTSIDVMIEQKINSAISNGSLDRQMNGIYGVRRRGN